MTVDYRVIDPTGNITILVETYVPAEEQPDIAQKLMELEPDAEQVGFIYDAEGADIALRMAGGEFCGNAAMSTAAVAAAEAGVSEGRFLVRVSGADEPVKAYVASQPDGSFKGTVCMPKPFSIEIRDLAGGGKLPVVNLPGISHVILEKKKPCKEYEKLVREWCRDLDADGLGLMFLDADAGTMTPLVYIPGADTLFWENSCASGTTAVGAYLKYRSGEDVDLSLKQPGGDLRIEASADGELKLSGTVRFRERKTAEIRS